MRARKPTTGEGAGKPPAGEKSNTSNKEKCEEKSPEEASSPDSPRKQEESNQKIPEGTQKSPGEKPNVQKVVRNRSALAAKQVQRVPTQGTENTVLWLVIGSIVTLLLSIVLAVIFLPGEFLTPFFGSRETESDFVTLGDSAAKHSNDGAAEIPITAPPPRKYNEKSDPNSAKSSTAKKDGNAPSCYTLEMYSDTFINQPRKGSSARTAKKHYYRCGTRLVDLTTEINSRKKDVCVSTTTDSATALPSLRVYLTGPHEVKAHTKERDNVAAQRIPLHRLNDDYCDCLDGTDEMLTNACSMSGAVAPLGHSRWIRHITANADVRLYEEEEPPSPARESRLRRRMGGPSLPFRCHHDQRVSLAPSRVNDGVVDCCDGSDESDPVVLKRWREAQEQLKSLLRRRDISAGRLFGKNRTLAALLLEKDLSSLLSSCKHVKKERLSAALVFRDVVERGNAIFKERQAQGWEKYGKSLVEQRGELHKKVMTASENLQKAREDIGKRMKEANVNDPIEAGVSTEELEEANTLFAETRQLEMQLRHASMVLNFHSLGDNYEYYPLAEKHLNLPASALVDTTLSTSDIMRQERARRRYNATYVLEAPPVHVDNISFRAFSVFPFLYMVGVQRVTESQATVFLRRSGQLGENETFNTSAYSSDDMENGPPFIMGYWYPNVVEESFGNFSSIDASGGAALQRRFLTGDEVDMERMDGGVGQRLPHERMSELNRHHRVLRWDKSRNSQEQLRSAAEESEKVVEVQVPQQHNDPHGPSVRFFNGGLACDLDDAAGLNYSTTEEKNDEVYPLLSHGRLSFVCDSEDSILAWHRNGKCAHEVLIGTPSACPDWLFQLTEKKVQQAEKDVQSDKSAA